MTDPITIARAQVAIENGLIDALRSQQQADMDGTTVIVSRQACDEAAEFLSALYDEVQRLRAALDDAAQAASNRAAYWWDEATAADDTGHKKLSLIYEAKALASIETAAAIRAMKGKPE